MKLGLNNLILSCTTEANTIFVAELFTDRVLNFWECLNFYSTFILNDHINQNEVIKNSFPALFLHNDLEVDWTFDLRKRVLSPIIRYVNGAFNSDIIRGLVLRVISLDWECFGHWIVCYEFSHSIDANGLPVATARCLREAVKSTWRRGSVNRVRNRSFSDSAFKV